MSQNSYTIKIDRFEGPFDLLLFFIERDELDINDIPISKITQDFLDYIKHLESLNIDVASEFILVAATLMRIKAKMLIPRKELDEEGNEIDPRQELAQKLLEYQRYKEILDDLSALESQRSMMHQRGTATQELKQIATKALIDVELESLTSYKLLESFRKIMEKYEERKNRVVHEIVRYEYTIREQQAYIREQFKTRKEVDFNDLFEPLDNRVHAIVTFLALLELLNLQQVEITQGEGLNNFWIKLLISE